MKGSGDKAKLMRFEGFLGMKRLAIGMAVATTSVIGQSQGALPPIHVHYCDINGTRYAFAITTKSYTLMQAWSPNQPVPPPVSPQQARLLAQNRLERIPIPDGYCWQLERISLEPANGSPDDKKWMYLVSFRFASKTEGMTGVWPKLDFIVTMSREVIEPEINAYKAEK